MKLAVENENEIQGQKLLTISRKKHNTIFLQSGLLISSNQGQVRSPLYLPDHCPIREIERTAVQHPNRLPVESEGSSLSI